VEKSPDLPVQFTKEEEELLKDIIPDEPIPRPKMTSQEFTDALKEVNFCIQDLYAPSTSRVEEPKGKTEKKKDGLPHTSDPPNKTKASDKTPNKEKLFSDKSDKEKEPTDDDIPEEIESTTFTRRRNRRKSTTDGDTEFHSAYDDLISQDKPLKKDKPKRRPTVNRVKEQTPSDPDFDWERFDELYPEYPRLDVVDIQDTQKDPKTKAKVTFSQRVKGFLRPVKKTQSKIGVSDRIYNYIWDIWSGNDEGEGWHPRPTECCTCFGAIIAFTHTIYKAYQRDLTWTEKLSYITLGTNLFTQAYNLVSEVLVIKATKEEIIQDLTRALNPDKPQFSMDSRKVNMVSAVGLTLAKIFNIPPPTLFKEYTEMNQSVKAGADIIDLIFWDFGGIDVTGQHALETACDRYLAEAEELLQMPSQLFTGENVTRAEEWIKNVNNLTKKMGKETPVCLNSQHLSLTTRLQSAKSALYGKGSRPEPLVLYLYGPPGQGKSNYIYRYLIPYLAAHTGTKPDYYPVSGAKHPPRYQSEHWAVWDEIGAVPIDKDDYIIRNINAICSGEATLLPGAALDEKQQYANFSAFFFTSNFDFVKLNLPLEPEAKTALGTRMLKVRVIDPLYSGDRELGNDHRDPHFEYLNFEVTSPGGRVTRYNGRTFANVAARILRNKIETFNRRPEPQQLFADIEPTFELFQRDRAEAGHGMAKTTWLCGKAGNGKTTVLVPSIKQFCEHIRKPCFVFEDRPSKEEMKDLPYSCVVVFDDAFQFDIDSERDAFCAFFNEVAQKKGIHIVVISNYGPPLYKSMWSPLVYAKLLKSSIFDSSHTQLKNVSLAFERRAGWRGDPGFSTYFVMRGLDCINYFTGEKTVYSKVIPAALAGIGLHQGIKIHNTLPLEMPFTKEQADIWVELQGTPSPSEAIRQVWPRISARVLKLIPGIMTMEGYNMDMFVDLYREKLLTLKDCKVKISQQIKNPDGTTRTEILVCDGPNIYAVNGFAQVSFQTNARNKPAGEVWAFFGTSEHKVTKSLAYKYLTRSDDFKNEDEAMFVAAMLRERNIWEGVDAYLMSFFNFTGEELQSIAEAREESQIWWWLKTLAGVGLAGVVLYSIVMTMKWFFGTTAIEEQQQIIHPNIDVDQIPPALLAQIYTDHMQKRKGKGRSSVLKYQFSRKSSPVYDSDLQDNPKDYNLVHSWEKANRSGTMDLRRVKNKRGEFVDYTWKDDNGVVQNAFWDGRDGRHKFWKRDTKADDVAEARDPDSSKNEGGRDPVIEFVAKTVESTDRDPDIGEGSAETDKAEAAYLKDLPTCVNKEFENIEKKVNQNRVAIRTVDHSGKVLDSFAFMLNQCIAVVPNHVMVRDECDVVFVIEKFGALIDQRVTGKVHKRMPKRELCFIKLYKSGKAFMGPFVDMTKYLCSVGDMMKLDSATIFLKPDPNRPSHYVTAKWNVETTIMSSIMTTEIIDWNENIGYLFYGMSDIPTTAGYCGTPLFHISKEKVVFLGVHAIAREAMNKTGSVLVSKEIWNEMIRGSDKAESRYTTPEGVTRVPGFDVPMPTMDLKIPTYVPTNVLRLYNELEPDSFEPHGPGLTAVASINNYIPYDTKCRKKVINAQVSDKDWPNVKVPTLTEKEILEKYPEKIPADKKGSKKAFYVKLQAQDRNVGNPIITDKIVDFGHELGRALIEEMGLETRIEPLTIQEAVAGSRFNTPMKRDTSCSAVLQMLTGANRKDELLDYNDETRELIIHDYVIYKTIIDQWEMARHRERLMIPATIGLKAELLPEEKLYKKRVFTIVDMITWINQSRIFAPVQTVIGQDVTNTRLPITLDPVLDFHHILKEFLLYSDFASFDFKDFDFTAMREVLLGVGNIMKQIYMIGRDHIPTKIFNVIDVMMENIALVHLVAGRTILAKRGGMTSGCAATSLIDGLATLLTFVFIVHVITDWPIAVILKRFKSLHGGDDMAVATDEDAAKLCPISEIVRLYKELFHMTLTLDDKKEITEDTEWSDRNSLVFLSRTFFPHPEHNEVWISCLKRESISAALRYSNTKDREQQLEQLESQAREIFPYGEAVYNRYLKTVRKFAEDNKLEFDILPYKAMSDVLWAAIRLEEPGEKLVESYGNWKSLRFTTKSPLLVFKKELFYTEEEMASEKSIKVTGRLFLQQLMASDSIENFSRLPIVTDYLNATRAMPLIETEVKRKGDSSFKRPVWLRNHCTFWQALLSLDPRDDIKAYADKFVKAWENIVLTDDDTKVFKWNKNLYYALAKKKFSWKELQAWRS